MLFVQYTGNDHIVLLPFFDFLVNANQLDRVKNMLNKAKNNIALTNIIRNKFN